MTLLCFESAKVESEELAMLKMFQVFRMGVVAVESERTHLSILARGSFVNKRMIKAFELIVNTGALLGFRYDLQVGSRDRVQKYGMTSGDFGRGFS